MVTRIIVSVLLVVAAFGCNRTISKEDQQAINEELRSREIRRITDAQIYDAAMKLGEMIADSSQRTLGKQLMHQVNENGTIAALEYCNLNAYPIIDSLSEFFNADIKRTSLRSRNPMDNPDELEGQLLDAYQYNVENSLELSPGIQKLDDGKYLYTKPIIANSGLCLQCHGEIGTDITDEVAAVIQERYPEDNATGHQINDLRGMWSIKLDQKAIIETIDF